MEKKEYTFDSVVRILFTVAIVAGVLYLVNYLKDALLPFLVAWLLAYMMFPLVKFIQFKMRVRNRPLSIFLALSVVVAVIGGATTLLIPSVTQEVEIARTLLVNYTHDYHQIPFIPQAWQDYFVQNFNPQKLLSVFDKQEWKDLLQKTTEQTWNFLSGSFSVIVNIVGWFIVLLYFIFILNDYEYLSDGFRNMIPNKYKARVIGLLGDVEEGMNKYFRGQALVASLVGVLFSIGFLIVGLPLAIPLGLFIGLLNMVPYLQVVGVVPTLLLCLLKAAETGGSFWLFFLFSMLVFCVVQLIQDIILVPRIMGKVTGLNPAIILLSLSLWGSLMGIIGMIIALPLTTLLVSYFSKYVQRQNAKNNAE